MDCSGSAIASIKHCKQRAVLYRGVRQLIQLEHTFHDCCGSGHPRICSLIQVVHSMIAVAVVCYRTSSLCRNMQSRIAVVMIIAGGEGAERCVAQSGARGVAVSTQRAAQPYEFAYDHVSGELGSQDDLFMREH